MIDEEKVLRMTKMASYEAHGGKQDKTVAGYFRGDYIGMQMLVSFLFVTLAFAVGIGAYLCFSFEEVMANIYTMDVAAVIKKVLLYYGIVLAVYLAATWGIYQTRYRRAKKRLRLFEEYLDYLGTDDGEG